MARRPIPENWAFGYFHRGGWLSLDSRDIGHKEWKKIAKKLAHDSILTDLSVGPNSVGEARTKPCVLDSPSLLVTKSYEGPKFWCLVGEGCCQELNAERGWLSWTCLSTFRHREMSESLRTHNTTRHLAALSSLLPNPGVASHNHKPTTNAQTTPGNLVAMARMRQTARASHGGPIRRPQNWAFGYFHRGGSLRLDSHSIDRKELKKIAKELAHDTELVSLCVGENNIGDVGIVALAGSLATNNSLVALSLQDNRISNVGLEALSQLLIQNTPLENLGVSGNRFGLGGLTSIANALKVNSRLKYLNLNRNSIQDAGAVVLADALKYNTGITTLDLDESEIGDEGVVALGVALKVNTTLARLDLCNNNIGEEGASSFLDVLTKWNTVLESVHFKHNEISSSTLAAIDALVGANRVGIRLLHAKPELDLSCKGISDWLASGIATELPDNTTVTTLILDDNFIWDTGSSAIATALQSNNVLTKLYLNGNKIGMPGVTMLAGSLRMNTCLQVLSVGENCFGNEGAVVMADALRSNGTLTRLDLDGNGIGDGGALALLTTLTQYNQKLTSLHLQNNTDISADLLEEIERMLASRRVLKSFLKCLGMPLEKKLMPRVIHAVQYNSDRSGARAGPIFHLVRASAWNDSKVIKETVPSRKRPRMP
jgi:Ran GTPase-activating protein (RanGAP) involved in mRNA processing and transport